MGSRQEFKNFLTAFNSYTNKEKKVIFLFAIIILLLILFNFISFNKNEDYSALHQAFLKNQGSKLTHNYSLDDEEKPTFDYQEKEFKYSFFNPNSDSEEKLTKAGIYNNIAKRIVNFRNSGGKFYQKEDLLKIYGIKEDYYSKIEPYIIINITNPVYKPFEKNQNQNFKTVKIKPKINEMDSTSLVNLYMIGEKLASRIAKFKEKLGGFYSLEQVKEVYGINDETYIKLLEQINSETGKFEKIQINIISKENLAKHPYFGKKMAEIVINFRNQHGNFETSDDLLKTKVINQEKLSKILPYLEL